MPPISRRDLTTGFAAMSLASILPGPVVADVPLPVLTVSKRTLEVKGRPASVFGLTGPDGKPGLKIMLGEHFRARLVNSSDVETLVHWHGLTPPIEQDGVPVLSQAPLKPGAAYDYDFANTRAGTYWMHSHVGLQEQQLLAAPLIVHETAEPIFDEQEHVVLLHDFTFRDPQEILAELKSGGGAHAGHAMGAMGQMDHSKMAHDQSGGMAMMMGAMLNDIVYDAYLANDRTLDDPEIIKAEPGGQIRLRIINGASASNIWIDLGEIEGELIAVDGSAIYPLRGSLFPIAIAQRADIRLRLPAGPGSYPIVFRPEGLTRRTGVIIAAGKAEIRRIPEEAEPAPAVDLAQEVHYRAVGQLPPVPVTRTEMLMLTGGGADYLWGLNGKPVMLDTIFTVRRGERMSIIMHNMTMMSHPMHLHGHYFKVTAINGRTVDGALRDVVLVPPMQTVTITFDADNPGTWAFHCHHVYHMNSGMMGALAYTSAA